LKSNATYPPAFTSLGIYYSEYASPLDAIRASKCFQKAFELDPREAFAARKLAEGFAEDGEWDLVEVVARRTIEGEGGLDAGITGTWTEPEPAARYLPTNAWAWKAVGIVELVSVVSSYSCPVYSTKSKNRRNYPSAIRGFQIALRGEPEDQLLWLRLGEAYNKDGRHGAALKALARAHELNPDDWMCAYHIGDVQRHMGHFEDAIAAFESILKERPFEVGVSLSLGEAHLNLGRTELLEKFNARAEHSFVSCIRVCVQTIQASPGFRNLFWKTMADAIFSLSSKSILSDEEGVRKILADVTSLLPAASDHLSAFMSPPPLSPPPLHNGSTLDGIKVLEIATAAYSYRMSLGSSESVATGGSAWFDLGVALHLWATKSTDREDGASARAKAVSCFSHALREDPGNVIYWIAMGDVHFLSHARTAQHAYVKALEIESKVRVIDSF
jgi:superkiller protein 3